MSRISDAALLAAPLALMAVNSHRARIANDLAATGADQAGVQAEIAGLEDYFDELLVECGVRIATWILTDGASQHGPH